MSPATARVERHRWARIGWVLWLGAVAGGAALSCGSSFTEGTGTGGASGGSGGTTPTGVGGSGGAPTGTEAGGTSAGGSGGEAGGSPAPCHPPDLVDEFAGPGLSPLWGLSVDPGMDVSVEAGRLLFRPATDQYTAQYGEVWSVQPYDLRECSVWLDVAAAFPATTSGDTYIQLYQSGTAYVEMGTWQGTLGFSMADDGDLQVLGSVPYDASEHRWWRLREAQGTLYYETAPDGAAWIQRHTAATPAFLSSVTVKLAAGIWEPSTTQVQAAFDNVDVIP